LPASLRLCAVGLLGHLLMVAEAGAQTPEASDVKNAIQFALQCNASLGTIEEVTLTILAPAGGEAYTVRGVYRHKIGGLNIKGFGTTDTNGGVFEGVYDRAARKLRALQFKISMRAGAVKPTCLR